MAEWMLAEYQTRVLRLCAAVLYDPSDAQDAAQVAFIKAADGLSTYRPGTNFTAWLLRIALNTCRSQLRRRAARNALQSAWQRLTDANRAPASLETSLVNDENRTELWRLVERLDARHRIVVILRLAEGLSIHEISQTLGVPEKTVYNRLYNAIAQLKEEIRRHPELALTGEEKVG